MSGSITVDDMETSATLQHMKKAHTESKEAMNISCTPVLIIDTALIE